MNMNILSAGQIMDSLIPISRFNKGEAGKIFDEVRSAGCKVVVKNNVPACVMMSPELYCEMMDKLADAYLYDLAIERLENSSGVTIPAEDVYRELGIEGDDDDEIPMVYGVDFA